ncbi:MAG: hypothetical protein H0W84_14985, partial [Bacteroidetes bacterium]|nr:hypothetical protein [Bacteroidota bacterium]
MKALKITLGTLLLFSKVIVAQVDTVYRDTTTRVVREQPQIVVVTPPTPPAPQPTEKPEPPFKSGEFGIRFMPGFSQIDVRNSRGGRVEGDFVVGYG